MSFLYKKSFLAIIFVLYSLFPASLFAARAITSVTLNNITSLSVAPLAIIPAQVTLTLNGGNSDYWRATAWRVGTGAYTCVNHTDSNRNGSYTKAFDIAAPNNVGTYDVSFIAYSDKACAAGASAVYTLSNALIVDISLLAPGTSVTCLEKDTANERCADVNLKPSFDLRFGGSGYSLYGDFALTGASVMCIKGTGTNCNWTYSGYLYDSTTMYLKEDNTTTFPSNSSKSTLSLPADVRGSDIVYARLYWQGHIMASGTSHNSKDKYLADIAGWDSVTFKTPNGAVHQLTANHDDKNWYGWWGQWGTDGMRFLYQANVDVTNIVKQSYSSTNNVFSAGNIKATEGTDSGTLFLLNNTWINGVRSGFWGGWSLFVVYQRDRYADSTVKLKNIALYDGFDAMTPWTGFTPLEIEVDFNGFMTPQTGLIDSKMAFLGFGGEKAIARDYFKISNQAKTVWYDLSNNENSATNPFNDTISYLGMLLDANKRYNPGMDLDTFDVSSYMTNSQSQTSLKLGGTYSGNNADQNFPSMVAFSTQLYTPDMCYEENITKNGVVPTQVYVGDALDFEVLISNKSDQPAKGVAIKKLFTDTLEYERNSTMIKNSTGVFIIKTDSANDDTVVYADPSKILSLNLGTGATSLLGGTFSKDQNETFRYKYNVQQDGNLTTAYTVSYQDDSNISGTGAINYANIPIGKCSDRTIVSTITPVQPSGKVRIVESGKDWNDYNGRLFTKIVNKSTSYDILFATNDTGATLTSGEIKKLEILNIENLASPVVVATPINTLIAINQRYPISLTHTKAYKRLQFRITLKDDSIAPSNDFSIRPADISGSIDNLWAGEAVTVLPGNIQARDYAQSSAIGYNKTLTASNIASVYIPPAKTCLVNTQSALIESLSILLIDGQSSSVAAQFKDIATGLIVSLKDSDWVGNSDDMINADCVLGSASNVVNAIGQFGCNVEGNLTVTVQPYELNITSSDFNASTGKTWLYDANVSDMFVTARATVQANNKQHQALQNFTASCYAQPVDLSFYYDVNNTNSNVNLSYVMTSGTMASTLKSVSEINKTITLPASLFTTSSASAEYRFNIDRAYNVPLSPIDVALKQVKVTSTAVAKDENNATVNKAARFYYGRIKTKDIVTDKTIAPHLLHVEVYSPTAISGFYQNTLNWYINADDDGTTVLSDGNFSENKAFLNNQPSTSVGVFGTTSFLDGILRFNINNLLEEKGSVVHVGIPTWLWNSTLSDYNNSVGATCVSHPCFDYKYIKDKDTIGIKSGTFKGSTIGNDYNATYQKSGVKTFR